MVYGSYQEFITDFMIEVQENSLATMIINYKDYQGMLSALCENVVCGNSLTATAETRDYEDDDINVARMNDGNMFITVFNSGIIVGEPALFTHNATAFHKGTYFVERDAAQVAKDYVIPSKVVAFSIGSATVGL